MKKIRKAGIAFLSVLFLCAIWQHKLVFYGIEQLKGQMHIIQNSESGDDFLNDPKVPATWKSNFRLISTLSQFASDSLGLRSSENYKRVYNQHDKPVLWVLTGCLPFEFTPKTWYFPFLGHVSYKGFFNEGSGKLAMEDLRSEGYDVDLSATSGWSTLGWFKDPVLSNMLKKSKGRLAELIIHELTHNTVFIKSNIEFNENLATFIGEQGALRFLTTIYGENSAEYMDYKKYKSDETEYGNYMIRSGQKLEFLYQSLHSTSDINKKAVEKKKMILQIMSGIDSLPLYTKARYTFNPLKDSLPNNTFFMSNGRYRSNQQKLEIILRNEFNGNLKAMINWLKSSKTDLLLKEVSQ